MSNIFARQHQVNGLAFLQSDFGWLKCESLSLPPQHGEDSPAFAAEVHINTTSTAAPITRNVKLSLFGTLGLLQRNSLSLALQIAFDNWSTR